MFSTVQHVNEKADSQVLGQKNTLLHWASGNWPRLGVPNSKAVKKLGCWAAGTRENSHAAVVTPSYCLCLSSILILGPCRLWGDCLSLPLTVVLGQRRTLLPASFVCKPTALELTGPPPFTALSTLGYISSSLVPTALTR